MEYARNVVGIADADSAEHGSRSKNFIIAPVACPVSNRRDGAPKLSGACKLRITPGCRLAAIYAADNAREAMDLMYRHGGSTSFQRESRLAECWRDLHVVGQTVTIAPEWYPIGGRVYLGMDPGPRLR